jgi:hypothetical protein
MSKRKRAITINSKEAKNNRIEVTEKEMINMK